VAAIAADASSPSKQQRAWQSVRLLLLVLCPRLADAEHISFASQAGPQSAAEIGAAVQFSIDVDAGEQVDLEVGCVGNEQAADESRQRAAV